MREWERAPAGLLETIVEMRAYATTKAQYEGAKTAADRPDTPLAKIVQAIDFELAQEEIDASTAALHRD